MIYLFILLFLLAVFFLIRFHINKFSLLMAGMLFSLSVLLLSMMCFISKQEKYSLLDNSLFHLDYKWFMKMSMSSISHYNIIALFTVAFGIYLALMIAFSFCYMPPSAKLRKTFNRIGCFTYLALVFYTIFYLPSSSFQIYILLYKPAFKQHADLFRFLVYTLDIFNYLLLVWCCVFPIILAYLAYHQPCSIIRKKQIFSATTCITLLNFLCIFALSLMTFHRPYVMAPPELLLSATTPHSISVILLWLFMLFVPLVLLLLFFIVIRYKLIGNVSLFRNYIIKQKLSANRNTINMLHSFKNVIFSYTLCILQAIAASDSQREEQLSGLVSQMDQYIEAISHTLNMNNSVEIEYQRFNLIQLLQDIIHQYDQHDTIRFETDFCSHNIEITADAFYLSDVFRNLITNAVEAIEATERTDGCIQIKATLEYEWLVLEINDNGKGIAPKDLRKIFRPFYSTKSTISNWGMGLSFVKKIIKIHGGQVYVQSSLGQGTEFTIVLPMRKKG